MGEVQLKRLMVYAVNSDPIDSEWSTVIYSGHIDGEVDEYGLPLDSFGNTTRKTDVFDDARKAGWIVVERVRSASSDCDEYLVRQLN